MIDLLNRVTRLVALLGAALAVLSCETERHTYDGPEYIMFSDAEYQLGVVHSEEWFEIPISATRPTDSDRTIAVEVLAEQSSAIEGYHYTIESNTLTIKAGEVTTSLRLRGIAEHLTLGSTPNIALRLVIDEELVWEEYGIEAEVTLHKCCPMDINAFTGWCKITSSWSMQYMGSDARLVRTELVDNQTDGLLIKDMFYDGYDIRLKMLQDNRLNPTVEMEPQQLGATGEAFGTIYGNGKLMMSQLMGTPSFYSPCENYMVLYTTIYVEEVGTVGGYIHILEWISDDEAERILREGF